MSDDVNDPVIVGSPLEADSMDIDIDAIDINDAIDLWDEMASPLFFGALEWNA